MPSFALPDETGESATPSADHVAGKPVVLVLHTGGADTASSFATELAAFRDAAADFATFEATIFAITRAPVADNGRLRGDMALPFQILSDPERQIDRAFGLARPPGTEFGVTIVVDPNNRVIEMLRAGGGPHAPRALRALRAIAPDCPPPRLSAHAPVLVLPRVLSEKDCGGLVDIWHRPAPLWHTDGLRCEGYEAEAGDFMVRNDSYGRVVQRVVRDPEVVGFLDGKLIPRVLPEIRKAFQTKVSRREDYRIACYDSADGGALPAHRDNPTGETRHRRFTAAVVLNAGAFSGGALRFREYGDHEYLIETGSAIVWSCSLLHEVTPITAGRRFIVGTHLFGT